MRLSKTCRKSPGSPQMEWISPSSWISTGIVVAKARRRERPLDDLADRNELALHVHRSRVAKQVADQTVEPRRLFFEDGEQRFAVLRRRFAPAQAGHRVGDDGERVANLVGDDRRQLADRGELLFARELALRFAQLFVRLAQLARAALELEGLIGELLAEHRRSHQKGARHAENEGRVAERAEPRAAADAHGQQRVMDGGAAHASRAEQRNDAVAATAERGVQQDAE